MFPVGLSFQQAPPFSFPFRFFITAPLFLLAAAMLLIFNDANLMVTRLSPAVLEATHLITLGFTSMVMYGVRYCSFCRCCLASFYPAPFGRRG